MRRSVMRHVRGKWYRVQARDAYQRQLLKASGNVRSTDPLVAFLYLLMRDCVPFGQVADLVEQALVEVEADPEFTNGWVGRYAEHLAQRLAIHDTVKRMRKRAETMSRGRGGRR